MPPEFIIFDTEFTAWEGSYERGWSEENEHRELIQLGAIKIRNFVEIENLLLYCKPTINPQLSDYIIELTGVTQEDVETLGEPFEVIFDKFTKWSGELPMYSYGNDVTVLNENNNLNQTGKVASEDNFHDVREIFKAKGVDTTKYHSGTIAKAFGLNPPPAHDALNDCRSILMALKAMNENL